MAIEDWKVIVLTPAHIGQRYMAIVESPRFYKPIPDANTGQLNAVAQDYGARFDLRYTKDLKYPATIDYWDTGIIFTGNSPRRVDMHIMHRSGSAPNHTFTSLHKERPTVADGTGGGSDEAGEVKGPYMAYVISSIIVPYVRRKKGAPKKPGKLKKRTARK